MTSFDTCQGVRSSFRCYTSCRLIFDLSNYPSTMPSLLKKLMTRARPTRQRQVQDEIDLLESPPPSPATDINRLAAQVLDRLQKQGHTGAIDQPQVRAFLADSQASQPPPPAKLKKESTSDKLKRLAVGTPPPRTRPVAKGDDGQKSLESLIGSISMPR